MSVLRLEGLSFTYSKEDGEWLELIRYIISIYSNKKSPFHVLQRKMMTDDTICHSDSVTGTLLERAVCGCGFFELRHSHDIYKHRYTHCWRWLLCANTFSIMMWMMMDGRGIHIDMIFFTLYDEIKLKLHLIFTSGF